MKMLILGLAIFASFQSLAEIIPSTKENKINVARIDKVVTLVDKVDMKVNVVVEDLGGSTDVSPTQNAFFTLYSKGEMFSTDATFNLGPIYKLISAKRLEGGVYVIKAIIPTSEGMMQGATLKVNAVKAINALRSLRCMEPDCEASENFSSEITVTTKLDN